MTLLAPSDAIPQPQAGTRAARRWASGFYVFWLAALSFGILAPWLHLWNAASILTFGVLAIGGLCFCRYRETHALRLQERLEHAWAKACKRHATAQQPARAIAALKRQWQQHPVVRARWEALVQARAPEPLRNQDVQELVALQHRCRSAR